ncbi:MAG: hypothetical protein KJ884_02030 [Gammaproteobacteria bacterium]|uniref:Uncharacterized protein n=1 Tax=viral metagenome TaxID=1070528 RepID=A0A6M3J7J8_9ZZZZ|nr:hypothetical protein [Gammaproteobacteria bacterium]MBU1492245.1 hypothetical protein [Gammaproteobacteria bacterium]MBU2066816.1 hypothetical protein [Gammaproteobacteria bacterium]MBU2137368.1 hypothetical protein [Gammaproteobacteria bacterium]MBU2215071.1 hypothetical protein [Gammaproteobacteria bacterium]
MSRDHITIAWHHFLLALEHSLRETRTALYDFSVESNRYHALGILTGAMNLEAIDFKQYERLAELVNNAAALRREELIGKMPLHSHRALLVLAKGERAA